jgi:hypothetical protein
MREWTLTPRPCFHTVPGSTSWAAPFQEGPTRPSGIQTLHWASLEQLLGTGISEGTSQPLTAPGAVSRSVTPVLVFLGCSPGGFLKESACELVLKDEEFTW